MEIHSKEDIIIPFVNVGDDGWEEKSRIVINAIADNWDDELKTPVSEDAINDVEHQLGTTLPKALKAFYLTFGIADIGEQLQELNEMKWLHKIWADQPQYGPDFSHEDQQHLPYLISFSDYLGNGNIICFHSETKEIYYFDHDGGPYLIKLFQRVDEYLKCCLIFAQNDLSEADEVETWTEEIVTAIVGVEVVRKWRY